MYTLQVDAQRTEDANATVLHLKVKSRENENAYIDYYVIDDGVVDDFRRVLPYEIILHITPTQTKPGVIARGDHSLGRVIIHKYESFEVRTQVPADIFKWGAHDFEGDMNDVNATVCAPTLPFTTAPVDDLGTLLAKLHYKTHRERDRARRALTDEPLTLCTRRQD